jgi:hypothetical protein
MSVCGQRHAPVSLLPQRDPVPTAQEAGSGLVRKFWPPEPRTHQPAASRYSDCGIPAHDSAEESVAMRDLSHRLCSKARRHFGICICFCYQMEVSGGTYWVVPTKGIVLNYKMANTNLFASIYAPIIKFFPREAKKSHKFTVTRVEIQMKTFTRSQKEKYASCGSGTPRGMARQFHLPRRTIFMCHCIYLHVEYACSRIIRTKCIHQNMNDTEIRVIVIWSTRF